MVHFPPFTVEQWMDEWETKAKYNIAETCSDSISLNQLLAMADMKPDDLVNSALFTERLTYGHILGSPTLRENIGKLYDKNLVDIGVDDVVVTQGAIAANFLLLLSICAAGTHVVCVDPTYQQLLETPLSFGSTLSRWTLKPEEGWIPNVEDLKKLLTPDTGLVIINNPNNPSGSLIPTSVLREIVAAVKELAAPGCVLMSDEVYRPLFHSDSEIPLSILELGYPHAVSTGSLSKAFSLAGTRVGWIATKDQEIVKKCLLRRDYNIISVSTLSDAVASLALNPPTRTKILDRNIALATENRVLVDQWIASQESLVTWVTPKAGTVGLLKIEGLGDGAAFCQALQEETGVMLVPAGLCFGIKDSVRNGYASSTEVLEEALRLLGPFLQNWVKKERAAKK